MTADSASLCEADLFRCLNTRVELLQTAGIAAPLDGTESAVPERYIHQAEGFDGLNG